MDGTIVKLLPGGGLLRGAGTQEKNRRWFTARQVIGWNRRGQPATLADFHVGDRVRFVPVGAERGSTARDVALVHAPVVA